MKATSSTTLYGTSILHGLNLPLSFYLRVFILFCSLHAMDMEKKNTCTNQLFSIVRQEIMDCMNRSGKFDKKFEAFVGNLCKLFSSITCKRDFYDSNEFLFLLYWGPFIRMCQP